jgi:hypothetical protein
MNTESRIHGGWRGACAFRRMNTKWPQTARREPQRWQHQGQSTGCQCWMLVLVLVPMLMLMLMLVPMLMLMLVPMPMPCTGGRRPMNDYLVVFTE